MLKQDKESRDRIYQISSNRGQARHKVRYVESSAPEAGSCLFCVGTLSSNNSQDLDHEPLAEKDEATKNILSEDDSQEDAE